MDTALVWAFAVIVKSSRRFVASSNWVPPVAEGAEAPASGEQEEDQGVEEAAQHAAQAEQHLHHHRGPGHVPQLWHVSQACIWHVSQPCIWHASQPCIWHHLAHVGHHWSAIICNKQRQSTLSNSGTVTVDICQYQYYLQTIIYLYQTQKKYFDSWQNNEGNESQPPPLLAATLVHFPDCSYGVQISLLWSRKHLNSLNTASLLNNNYYFHFTVNISGNAWTI